MAVKEIKINTNGTETIQNIDSKSDLVKIEVPGKQIDNTNLKVVYEINLTNKGTVKGEIEKIIDELPKGLTFSKQDNPDWSEEGEKLILDKKLELEKDETKKVSLTLNWDLKNNNIGTRNNISKIDSKSDIDQMLIENVDIKIEDTNNIDNIEVLIAIKTGGESLALTLIIATCLSILTLGIYLIKKYVI